MTPEIWFPNLGIQIQHLSKVAFNIGGLPVYWYGVITVSSIFLALAYVTAEAKRTGQNPDNYYDLLVYGIVGALIGARLYYVAFSWDDYRGNLLKIFALREGGQALYGSLIGGIITVYIYTRVRKHNFLLFTDTIAPGFILAQATGRLGNFINREAFGGFTEGLFAMRCLVSTVPYIPYAVLDKIITVDGASYIQVHPTFLYESVWNFAGFAFLVWFIRREKSFNGQVTAMYFLYYGTGRFFIEGMRTDQLLIGSTCIAASQLLSGLLIAASVCALFYLGRRNRKGESV